MIKVFFKSISAFFNCKEVPLRDRWVVFIILLLIISPIDFIPDTIPGIGVLDDLFLLALLYDFAFKVLPRELALKLYAGNKLSYERFANIFFWLGWLKPVAFLRRLWRIKSLPENKLVK